MDTFKKYKKYSLIFADFVCIVFSYLAFILIRFDEGVSQAIVDQTIRTVLLTTVCATVSLIIGGCYNTLWKYSSVREYGRTMGYFGIGVIPVFLARVFFSNLFLSHKIILIFSFLAAVIVVINRVAIRMILSATDLPHKSKDGANTLIVGGGSAAKLLIEDILRNQQNLYRVVGIIDDNPQKVGRSIHGYRVFGSRKDIPQVAKAQNVEVIIIAIPSVDQASLQKILSICSETACKIKILPGIEQSMSDKKSISSNAIRDVEIEDLLERDPIHLDNQSLKSQIAGKTVLVTGGGGSIGSELCRQIAKYNPGKLVVVDCYENNAYDLQQELRYQYPDLSLDVIIASVRDQQRLDELFAHYRPQLVFHAAAHKHVPLMEKSPQEAIKNNVFGTLNTALTAHKYQVEKFVLISTDKAVNPTNIMGATKRICEMITQSIQSISETDFVAVRFGNVLGSNGSVIPLFRKQIQRGGPVTVTHKDITRYFMTIPEASQLVLQAASFATGGEIFVLDMGRPVKIYDLAEKLIRLSGYTPGKDIEIKVSGLRPGEKLYEELLMAEEGLTNTSHNKIFIGQPIACEYEQLTKQLETLKAVLYDTDPDGVKKAVAAMVDTYTPDLDAQKVK
ncbi:MAG: polysaccharide biosynthesis protein [Ruminococcaceae bacterium]|nr:polysaccharide biosynthesis protein [Oscillospiraceae bacterium]